MNRRDFLLVTAGAAATASALPQAMAAPPRLEQINPGTLDGHVEVAHFSVEGTAWAVWEDLRTRDGGIVLVSAGGALRLPKRTEAMFSTAAQPYLGIPLRDIAMADADLLADKLLAGGGDPDPARVRDAAPPAASNFDPTKVGARHPWTAIVGTRQAGDTMPVFPNGRTRGYRPEHEFPALYGDEAAKQRWEGLLGGWLPAVHKIIPISDTSWYDLIVFADVDATDPCLVQTWHRTVTVEKGRPTKTVFAHSYAPFPPRRTHPDAAAFYAALLRFSARWQSDLADLAALSLPDQSYGDMVAHAFAKELIVRPGGVYPKYGSVDRDYFGSEYDGFQDTFTSSLYANLEWGRFEQAKAVLIEFFDDFVADDGMINMRGPEVAQFGLTLTLLRRYLSYTGDGATLARLRGKIQAHAAILAELHDLSLALSTNDRGYGLLHGWSESDACLHPDPTLWWKPYWNNSAWAVRGWKDIAQVWTALGGDQAEARDWSRRAERLQDRLIKSIRANVRRDLTPPYLGPLPGVSTTFRQELATKKRSEQDWAHRVYAELLQADVLPNDLANLIADCVRGHGGTCIGVTANFAAANERSRSQLGFISYGHAQALLRMDRIEEYLLFLHSHRYHSHLRGAWVAGEVSSIDGELPLFCIPAQLTIPLLVKWMLVDEASDADTLHLGRAIPRAWFASKERIAIDQSPTRWGKISYATWIEAGNVLAEVRFERTGPRDARIRFRLPDRAPLLRATVNGKVARIEGDTVRFDARAGGEFRIAVSIV